jgi:toxin ParE1/3/4
MSSALTLKVSPVARRDIERILRHSQEAWGVSQANRYAIKIDRALEAISENPARGSWRPDIPTTHRALIVGSHIIIYRERIDFVQISRVLHQHMNRADHA